MKESLWRRTVTVPKPSTMLNRKPVVHLTNMIYDRDRSEVGSSFFISTLKLIKNEHVIESSQIVHYISRLFNALPVLMLCDYFLPCPSPPCYPPSCLYLSRCAMWSPLSTLTSNVQMVTYCSTECAWYLTMYDEETMFDIEICCLWVMLCCGN